MFVYYTCIYIYFDQQLVYYRKNLQIETKSENNAHFCMQQAVAYIQLAHRVGSTLNVIHAHCTYHTRTLYMYNNSTQILTREGK